MIASRRRTFALLASGLAVTLFPRLARAQGDGVGGAVRRQLSIPDARLDYLQAKLAFDERQPLIPRRVARVAAKRGMIAGRH